jgi:hypothetical protein
LSGIIIEPNIGGGIHPDLVTRSLQLFAREVMPRLQKRL